MLETRFGCQPGDFEVLLGARVFHESEDFRLTSILDADTGTMSHYHIESVNHLIGVQTGGRYSKCLGPVTLETTLKAGLYGNPNRQGQTATDFNNTLLIRDVATTDTAVSFIGDLEVLARYRITNNVDF